ncbi:MAG: NAD(P)/FAD-dependent oxidoreductase [Proteobacteria bacterium]|nr:NAD(P)/FAD-dependent oxidoreductase [Pseudomonadota bacterium]
MEDYDVIILGAGAAGLMCAITAGNRGRRVLILESSNKIGKKILMSGGGRCNFTNVNCDPSHFMSANPKFCISALSRYTPWDFIALVDKHGIAYHEKTLGQLFCDESSKQILQLLVDEAAQAGVTIRTHFEVATVTHSGRYIVKGGRQSFSSDSLVIATGGLSIPKMGATDFGYRMARQFGLHVQETRAGLVPFTFTGDMHTMLLQLSGVSIPSRISTAGVTFAEDLLFTHRGLSGPAILQVSSYWTPGDTININLLPDCDAESMLLQAKQSQPKSLLRTVLSEILPRALVLELQAMHWQDIAATALREIADDRLRTLASALQNWHLKPAATEGYRTAEVTIGGVDTDELSSKTMECKRQPGLYCIGEVVDVTGHLGGFNFQWAWASGHAAGQVT